MQVTLLVGIYLSGLEITFGILLKLPRLLSTHVHDLLSHFHSQVGWSSQTSGPASWKAIVRQEFCRTGEALYKSCHKWGKIFKEWLGWFGWVTSWASNLDHLEGFDFQRITVKTMNIMMNMDFSKTYFNCKCNKAYFYFTFLGNISVYKWEVCVYVFLVSWKPRSIVLFVIVISG